ncbi:hydrolase-like protein [Trypanosoma grayi]|uniref:hydrolase-like protein n=1 Tax=Trypanosoma grayi TaxID=71804 RepID=UPI0004F40CA3|nr:hydrolase-like protein [Trypanosoma grayi]KEG11232.1 hydrolase-like protein [Trypanosoma grayi]
MRSAEHLTFVRYCTSSDMRIELCYQCFGDPCKKMPVVLLIGGLNMQMYAWDEAFCEELVAQNFFVVRFDNRDIGLSTKIEQRGSIIPARLFLPQTLAFGERLPYTIEDMARDALALLDALGITYAHVMGISMGGMIAQTVALLSPHRTLSLTSIMSTTNARDLPDPQLWVKVLLLRKPPTNCTLEELLDFRVETLKRLLSGALPVDEEYLKLRYLISLRRSAYSAGLIRQAAAIRRCPGRDEALRSLSCPALVVHGVKDVLMPPAHGYRTASMIPQAKLLTLESMGHYFHPAFFGTIVSDFVAVANAASENGSLMARFGFEIPTCMPLLQGTVMPDCAEQMLERSFRGTTEGVPVQTTPIDTSAEATKNTSLAALDIMAVDDCDTSGMDASGIMAEELRMNILGEQVAEASILSMPEELKRKLASEAEDAA